MKNKVQRLLNRKTYLGLGLSFLLVIVLAATVFAEKAVLIQIDEVEVSSTFRGKKTVEDILEEENIELIDADDISLDFEHVLEDGDAIRITKAVSIKVTADNRIHELMTTENSVEKILDDLDITVNELDIITPSMNSSLEDGGEINIVRVEEELETNSTKLSYKSIENKNNKLDKGKTKLVQKGSDGLKTITEKIVYHNGEEHSREVVDEEVKEPVDEIKEVGTKKKEVKKTTALASRGSSPAPKVTKTSNESAKKETASTKKEASSSNKTLTVEATAYYQGSVTASGTKPKANHTIAASSQLPFGTKVYIPALGKTYTVEDRGGAIKGNKIDVFVNTREEAINFGRRSLEIEILN